MNEQQFLKILVSYGATVLFFIGVGWDIGGKFMYYVLCIIFHELLFVIPLFLL